MCGSTTSTDELKTPCCGWWDSNPHDAAVEGFAPREASIVFSGQIQMIARMAKLAGLRECAHRDKILQVPCRGSA
jgi:hypothetical protein